MSDPANRRASSSTSSLSSTSETAPQPEAPPQPQPSPQSSEPSDPRRKNPLLHRAIQRIIKPPRRERGSTSRWAALARRRAQGLVEPLASSPLRGVSTVMSRSASPERQLARGEDTHAQRDVRDGSSQGDRRAPTAREAAIEEDAKSDVSTLSSDQTVVKKKTQGRKAMAAMMSGLEGRLFPRSLSRGRESSRGPSSRSRTSSLDSRAGPSTARLSRSASPTNRKPPSSSHPDTPASSSCKEKSFRMDPARNKSDDALVSKSETMPTYVRPTEHAEPGERVAKDVFDRENKMLASSSDDDHNGDDSDDDGDDEDGDDDEESDDAQGDDEDSDEDEPSLPGVTFVTAGRGRQTKSRASGPSSNTRSGEASGSQESKPASQDTQPPSSKHNIPNQDRKPGKSVLKSVVRPQTNFEVPTPRARSAAGTPCGSDDEEEEAAINRAQRLSIYVSAIDNRVPNRSIRTIVRGEFDEIQQEAAEGRRRQRKYLVATDLSQESEYALEWTIGGLLRPGDTMYAIFAIHEDANAGAVQVGEGAKAMQDAVAVVGNQTKEASGASRTGTLNLLGRLSSGVAGKTSSVETRVSPAAEAERVRAVEKISDICIGFLRKTGLSVRIAVEVIHCKSPKQMITEAIDELEPTLAIVGARGQSALKGVLLGSFSNYLISKSSVPVMVARHKLQRQLATSQTTMRLANNLTASKTLREKLEAEAKEKAKAEAKAKAQAKAASKPGGTADKAP
ncbi:hypothetical protein POX_a01279 [Penicillium oxalicum]|uniref:hypothetical protein n=1 Tax=Penicillium oxalicum TaxID=69781 RepID=UPI0020B66A1F|nr:hypothetical protein POX_a01279 [Penicillium oxalicum]KAI2794678.1 hypothetical protein POX_a01279 [Penicillium oxalicum]